MTTNKALKTVLACYSYKGHDYDVKGQYDVHSAEFRRFAKKATVRAHRRLNKALINEAV